MVKYQIQLSKYDVLRKILYNFMFILYLNTCTILSDNELLLLNVISFTCYIIVWGCHVNLCVTRISLKVTMLYVI